MPDGSSNPRLKRRQKDMTRALGKWREHTGALVSAAEKNAVQLAMAIARKVIQREFHIEPNDVAAQAIEALESVRHSARSRFEG